MSERLSPQDWKPRRIYYNWPYYGPINSLCPRDRPKPIGRSRPVLRTMKRGLPK